MATKEFFVPALQKKEARPTGALVFLWLLFLLPIGSCGTVGSLKLHQALARVVEVDAPQKLATLGTGSYASADLRLTRLARDLGPMGDGYFPAHAHGHYEAYEVEGASDVIVASTEPSIVAGGGDWRGVRVQGQMCDADTTEACELPDELRAQVRDLQTTRKIPVHVLVANQLPHDRLWEAFLGLGVAGVVAILALVTTGLLLRAAASPGVVVLERSIVPGLSADDVRARIRSRLGPACRLAHDTPSLVVLLLGKPVGQARLTGAMAPESVPLRADVEFASGEAYRGSPGRIRVLALWTDARGQSRPIAPVARLAAEHAAAWISAASDGAA